MKRASLRTLVTLGVSLVLFLPRSRAAEPVAIDSRFLDQLPLRCIGPANMSGRVTDIAVVEDRPYTMYVATASGGLWKTTNNGVSWSPLFDQAEVASIGDVTVAPTNPNLVWVGTGEANARNSVSWGDGVYRSSDGGKSWVNVGLRDSHHIGRIVIHPRNPDIVYVAALGHLWGPNRERGLFKTTDGGKTWQPSLFVNEDTGCIDVVIDPTSPETLYAAMYQVRRDSYSAGNPATHFGPGSGLYRTDDGGKTWQWMTQGLPGRPLGRCGLDLFRKDPRILCAVVQTDRTDVSTIPGQAARTSDDVATGGIFRSEDRGQTWSKVNDLCPRPFYYGQVRIDPHDPQRICVLGISKHVSTDGGRTFHDRGAPGVHGDHHALWINPRDPEHMILGNDGGVYFTYDRGRKWEHVKNLPVAQFYAVGVDMRKPYRIYGGLQDNGTWGGPSATRHIEGITLMDWYKVLGADGFHCQVDPTDVDTVYAETQYGGLHRVNVRTGERITIRPAPPSGQPAYRFNWSSPMLLSPHDPHILYYAGNHLFRSTNCGDRWSVISPDLTRGQPGPSRNMGQTCTTIAESSLRAGVIWVGTDDGRVHVTRDGGGNWTDVSDRVPGVPAERWISRLECSRFAEGTAYLSIDRHRNDDRAPYLFKTTDYGATWKPIAGNLPAVGHVHVVHEGLANPNLLLVGTEFGLFVSLDGGMRWQRIRGGTTPSTRLPTVAVHDLVLHPRDRELVIATHGRGIYVMDIAPLEELTSEVARAPVHVFQPRPAIAFEYRHRHGLTGGKGYVGPNPPYGAVLHYYLSPTISQSPRITISSSEGQTVAVFQGPREPGLNRLVWPLRHAIGTEKVRLGPQVPAGAYTITLQVGNQTQTRKLLVEAEE